MRPIDVEVREKCQIKISKRLATFENSDDSENIKMACETIRENSKIKEKNSTNYSEQKQHNKCFDKKCSKLLDQRKQTKL
jgi:bifunctional DNA-binding transcriptional regulator/antitoxin component of YhaV-PrlF toxin-antitoxin module